MIRDLLWYAFYMGLFLSHYLDHGFGELTMINSSYILYPFFIDFFYNFIFQH
jgi:hypothetical protein